MPQTCSIILQIIHFLVYLWGNPHSSSGCMLSVLTFNKIHICCTVSPEKYMWQSAITANTQQRHRLIEKSEVYFFFLEHYTSCLCAFLPSFWNVLADDGRLIWMAFVIIYTYLRFYSTWTYHRKMYALIFCDKPNAQWFYSHVSNEGILYWFFQCFWSCSETISRIGSQASQGWYQIHSHHIILSYKQRFPSHTHLQTNPLKKKQDFTFTATHSVLVLTPVLFVYQLRSFPF